MTRKEHDLNSGLQGLRDLWAGFQASRVVLTANNLGIFEQLRSARTAPDLARMLKTDARATEILLDALASLGLLKKSGATYRNGPAARRFLVTGGRLYQGDMLRHADSLWKSWSSLDDVVRTGRPDRSTAREYSVFIRAMHNNSVVRVREIVDALDLRGVRTALDLGGGPGTYSIELAKRRIAVTLFDLPEALAVARGIVRGSGVKTVRLKGGDFHSDDIGRGYDLVLVSHILHSLSPEKSVALLQKVRQALNPKGVAAIHEFALAENRAAPPSGALFSINMLVNTESGRSYSAGEMRSWLLKSGFSQVRVKRLPPTVLLTAVKK